MPEIRPFRGWRYAGPQRDLTRLSAPPYDVIAPEFRDELRDRDPHNVVRLILPLDEGGVPGSRYAAARRELDAWAGQQVLTQDPEPGFYPYRQTYRVERREESARVGFLGLLRLQPFGGDVMAHEHTLAAPREDRYQLLSAARANLSPVFVLFQDPDGRVTGLLQQAMARHWEARADRVQGEHDELWRLSDPAACEALTSALSSQPLVFADGHHRYESAVAFMESLVQKGEDPGTAAYMMAYFAPVPQPGLAILPTHRIVHGVDPARIAALRPKLEQHFDVRTVCRRHDDAHVEAWESHAAAVDRPVLGLAVAGDDALLELALKPGAAEAALPHLAPELRRLDVSVLHEAILGPLLGIGEEELKRQSHVRYSHETVGALEELSGDAQAVFLLRPTPIEAVFDVARAGLRMPQKSTFFYPKLATGFVFHRHEPLVR